LLAVPVPARDERDREYDKSTEWQKIFAHEFGDFYREWLPKEVNPTEALNRIFIPYIASWSFGERIPVIESERERVDPTSLGAAYARLATLLSNRLDWSALDAKASTADVMSSRVELSKAREMAEEAESRVQAEKQRTEDFILRSKKRRLMGYKLAFILVFIISMILSLPYIPLRIRDKVPIISNFIKPSLSMIVTSFTSTDLSTRLEAITSLNELVLKDSTISRYAPQVAGLLKDNDSRVRQEALLTLSHMGHGGEKFAPMIAELLHDSVSTVRRSAVITLREMGNAGISYAKDIANLIADTTSLVSLEAAQALNVFELDKLKGDRDLYIVLTKVVYDKKGNLASVAGAIKQMIRIDATNLRWEYLIKDNERDEFASILVDMLIDVDPEVKKGALYTFGSMGKLGVKYAPKIANLLDDADDQVRISAVKALGEFGLMLRGSRVVDNLISVANFDDNPQVRDTAFYALQEIGVKSIYPRRLGTYQSKLK
jgi:HEAT repeat protein